LFRIIEKPARPTAADHHPDRLWPRSRAPAEPDARGPDHAVRLEPMPPGCHRQRAALRRHSPKSSGRP
jgi:hypothetical protein